MPYIGDVTSSDVLSNVFTFITLIEALYYQHVVADSGERACYCRASGMPADALKASLRELKRLKKMPQQMPEHAMLRYRMIAVAVHALCDTQLLTHCMIE